MILCLERGCVRRTVCLVNTVYVYHYFKLITKNQNIQKFKIEEFCFVCEFHK